MEADWWISDSVSEARLALAKRGSSKSRSSKCRVAVVATESTDVAALIPQLSTRDDSDGLCVTVG